MGIFIVLVECLLKNCYLDKQEILSAHNVRTIALNAFNFIATLRYIVAIYKLFYLLKIFLICFKASLLSILFAQKKIKQFKVEFMEVSFIIQMLAMAIGSMTFISVLLQVYVDLGIQKIPTGRKQTKAKTTIIK